MSAEQTILIIDDIVENIDILERQLEKEGFKILTALEGPKGLHLLKEHDIDLVLLDINMPVVDGITLLENIKKDSSLANIAVMMVTANEDIKIALKCLKMGACGYITKPFTIEQLRKQVDYCINKN